MKKIVFLLFLVYSLAAFAGRELCAEESSAPPTSTESTVAPPTPETPIVAAPYMESTPTASVSSSTDISAESTPAPADISTEASSAPIETTTAVPTPAAAPENKIADNLEFVSGEITGTDEAAKTITIKLYGETENAANDKILTIKLDETTDITDGEKDRDMKSLTNGTEVDVEYDPTTSKATYIFVY